MNASPSALTEMDTLILSIHQELEQRGIQPDTAQQAAIQTLVQWFDRWQKPRRMLTRYYDGVYLWGSVGRGKSLVMDAFYQAVPVAKRRRVHVHAFLQEVQIQLRDLTGQPDPLALLAQRIAEQTQLLCFDEYHVHDIGDAILLGRLLVHLQKCEVGMVMTSNYPPQGLCPNPLYRERFKPAIALLERHFQVLNLDGGQDYRLHANGGSWGYYSHPWAQADQWLPTYLGLTQEAHHHLSLEVNRHAFPIRACEGTNAWIDFDPLCRQPRSSADFLWLCQSFSRVAIDRVPHLDTESIDVQQRFLNFVDIAYDQGIELLVVGSTALDSLLTDRGHVDFSRTRSRLSQLSAVQI